MKRILVTGGSGFVGTNLVEYFINQGWQVSNFDIHPPRNRLQAPYWKSVDIRNSADLTRELTACKPEIVLHCAARTDLDETRDLDGYSANIDGVCHLIQAIRMAGHVRRTIFFSTQLVYPIGVQPATSDEYQPTTLYGRSKVLGEKIVKTAGDFGSSWAIVRPTSLWGPWFGTPYRSFFTTIQRGYYIHPRGVKTHKQWGFIGNSVYQIARLLQAPEQQFHEKTYYLADYSPVALNEFADQIQHYSGSPRIKTLPLAVLQTAALFFDLLQGLGWRRPPLTSFRLGNILSDETQDLTPLARIVGDLPFGTDQGIQATVSWLRDESSEVDS